MKSASKWIVLALALTFLFAMAVPAFAADSQKSTQKLMSLGIVSGDPDGDLRLDDTITRAEFAKVAVMAAGLESAADVLSSAPSEFSDVKADAWYTGWINVAAAQGLVKGDGNGLFRPNDEISGSEVVTVLLRLLGYNDNLPGSWPTDYIVKAASLDITKDVSFSANAAAVRGDVFVMADKTLDTKKAEWDADKEKFVEQDDKLIADSFEGSMEKGFLTNVKWSKGNMKVSIDNGALTDVADDVTISGGPDMFALLGSKIDYVLNDDDEIVYAAPRSFDYVSDKEMTIDGDVLTIDDEDYDIASDFRIIYGNGTAAAAADGDYDADQNDAAFAIDKATVVLNSDGEAQYAFVSNNVGGDIVDEIDNDTLFSQFGNFANYKYDSDDDVVVVRNGAIASFEDIQAGDLVYVYSDIRGLDYLIYAFDAVNSGTLEGYNADGDQITVDGTKYDLDTDAIVSNDGGDTEDALISDMVDENIEFRLSPAGKVAVAISDVKAESDDLYGILLAGDSSSFGDVQVKILTAEGSKVIYDVVSKASDLTVVDEGAVLASEDKAGLVAYDGNPATEEGVLVAYRLNDDGEVKYVKVIDTNDTTADKDGNRLQWDGGSWDRIASDVAIFVADSVDGNDNVTAWTTATWDELADAVGGGALDLYYVKDGSNIVAISSNVELSDSANYGVVAGSGFNSDGFYYDVLVNGEKVRYNTVDGDEPGTVLGKGTFVDFDLVDGEFSLNDSKTKAESQAGGVEVTKVGTGYFNAGGYNDINDDTEIVDVTGSTPSIASRIARGDYVYIPAQTMTKGYLKIVLIVKAPAVVVIPEPTGVTLTVADDGTATVSGNVYDADADSNIWVVRMTDQDAANPAVVTISADSATNGDDTDLSLDFTGDVSGNTVYKYELYNAADMSTVVDEVTKFIAP